MAGLLAYAVLSLGFLVLQPDLPDDQSHWLAAIADAGWCSGAATQLLIWSQLPLAVGAVGLAAWLRPQYPRLSTTGVIFAVLGAFGHTVVGGLQLGQVVMAGDVDNRDAHADLLAAQWASPLIAPFTMLGVLCTVVGILLLSIAHFRARLQPRWAGPVLWAWIVVEFVAGGISPWATYLSGILLLMGCGGLAAGLFTAGRRDHAQALVTA
ncbi:hypothetical protein ACLQ2Y_26035 [Micromonospora echinospora]|uniref:DUF4386 family protein n=1 Tax=Micromonospora echinospora TaxID=1877 RepID=A0ABR6MB38_MICEC|nr:hypothetical protein [Micromonospora echinospora]MBB5112578.1 hypothetical protein [Micromonospora echinospora]